MPGLVGLITTGPSGWARSQLNRMVESIRHEAFHEIGTWVEEPLGIYVGWAAAQNSFSDGMPLKNGRGDVVLFFSGEEYRDPEMLCRLQQRGPALTEKGPSYLVNLQEEDRSFPAGLNGRFHGLLADRTHGETTLFNDRYGMHRIYYHETKEAFYFAVEAKAILAICPQLRKVKLQSLGEFITCGCVLENRTLFDRVHVLPPASAWIFRNGSINRKAGYFRPEDWESQPRLDPQSYYEELRGIFSKNLPRHFNGSQKIGMSLTGGLDTRAIMAWRKPPPGTLPCYSFGGMLRESQDVLVARRVAQASGQPYDVIQVGKEFLSQFPRYAERTVYLTDGCTAVNHSVDLYLNEHARQIAPVRMTGNYGGEVLRRVRAFKPRKPPAGLFHPDLLPYIGQACETYDRLTRRHPLSFAVFLQAPWHHYGLLALEQTQLSIRTPYLDNDLIRTVFRAPDSVCQDDDICLRLIADGDKTLCQIRTDRGIVRNGRDLLSGVSRYLLDFTFKAEYAFDYGMPQWAARIDHLISSLHAERLFLGRHKFSHFRVWYRDYLARYVQQMLLDPRTLARPYVQRGKLETMVKGHLKGDSNFTSEIHLVLTLELLHRLFIDSN